MKQNFFKYVSKSVAGMIGISVYVLADTYFISLYSGADGITVLNLALPLYGLIFAIGSMIGIGSATVFAIKKAQNMTHINKYFSNSILWQIIFSIPFILLALLCPQLWLSIMGGNQEIIRLGTRYVQIVLLGAPFFMMNYSFTAFSRNDNAPTTAMVASLCASAFNIVFDYIFMFPLNMGISGAALATILSPVLSSIICCSHFLSKKSTVKFVWIMPCVKLLFSSCKLGVSAFVGEISSAVTTTVFNILLLKIAGNIGVASYGVVANLSLVAISIFNGIAQGVQPLISKSYGEGKFKNVTQLLRLGIILTTLTEAVIITVSLCFTDSLVNIFNSEGNKMLSAYAHNALQLYFLGFIFAGVNILLVTYFSATNNAVNAFVSSTLRGVVAIGFCAVVMSVIWGINGIWLSFAAAETITFVTIIFFILYRKNKGQYP